MYKTIVYFFLYILKLILLYFLGENFTMCHSLASQRCGMDAFLSDVDDNKDNKNPQQIKLLLRILQQ